MSGKGLKPVEYLNLGTDSSQWIAGEVPEEDLACLNVNGEEIATFMCTPVALDQLAVGLLYNEGIISGVRDIQTLHISDQNCVEVWLSKPFTPPQRLIITAGCGGGITFDDLTEQHQPLKSSIEVSSEVLVNLMKDLHHGASLYQRSRGIHTAVLAIGGTSILQVEDIGRHNCIDRISGMALLQDIQTRDGILLSSGRISSEMINKARRMEVPIVCSRTSPTSLSVELAQAWNITLVAYLRQSRMRVYTHPERIQTDLTIPVNKNAGSAGQEALNKDQRP